jgi:hypothetical protein
MALLAGVASLLAYAAFMWWLGQRTVARKSGQILFPVTGVYVGAAAGAAALALVRDPSKGVVIAVVSAVCVIWLVALIFFSVKAGQARNQ